MQLVIENLHVSYGKIKALHGLDFNIAKGEIVCIIGANGAGKSTTLRAISRLLMADKGSRMEFEGKDLLQYQPDKVVSELGISHYRQVAEQATSFRHMGYAQFTDHFVRLVLEQVFAFKLHA